MTVLYIVLPLALLIAAVAVGAFAWSAKSGQLDDLETPAQRALLDDDPVDPSPADDPQESTKA